MTDEIESLMDKVLSLMVAEQLPQMTEELNSAEDGTLNVSIGVKLTLTDGKVYAAGRLAFRHVFLSEAEQSIDLRQEKLPL